MSRRAPNNTKRIERRAEREARQPSSAPRARRERTERTPVKVKSGFLANMNWP